MDQVYQDMHLEARSKIQPKKTTYESQYKDLVQKWYNTHYASELKKPDIFRSVRDYVQETDMMKISSLDRQYIERKNGTVIQVQPCQADGCENLACLYAMYCTEIHAKQFYPNLEIYDTGTEAGFGVSARQLIKSNTLLGVYYSLNGTVVANSGMMDYVLNNQFQKILESQGITNISAEFLKDYAMEFPIVIDNTRSESNLTGVTSPYSSQDTVLRYINTLYSVDKENIAEINCESTLILNEQGFCAPAFRTKRDIQQGETLLLDYGRLYQTK